MAHTENNLVITPSYTFSIAFYVSFLRFDVDRKTDTINLTDRLIDLSSKFSESENKR